MRTLYLGLDNTQPNLVRAVCISTSIRWQWIPSPFVWTQSRSLDDFKSFWQIELGNVRPDGLATTVVPQDPFGAVAWLEQQGMTLDRYHRYDLYHGYDEAGEADELPDSLRRAYALALHAAFKSEGPAIALELAGTLYSLEERVAELRRILDGLVGVVEF